MIPQLHVRSSYAPMIGMCAPKALAHAMAPAGVVAATDPNLWGAAKLARACAEAPGKPRAAFGLEIRLREWPGHVVLLARTALGWRNLCAVAALVYGPADAVGLPPRAKPPHAVPLATIVARGLLGGLAVLTGGAAGCLCVSLGGPVDHATRSARELGPGGDHARADAFLEAMASACDQWLADRIAVATSPRAATPEEAPRLYVELAPTMGAAWRACWEAAIRHDLDVVATSDASYLRREDAPTRLVLRAIAEKRRLHLDEIAHLAPSSRAALEEPSAWGHLASDEEMSAFFADCPAALESARSLGEELRVDLGLGKVALPDYRDASGRALDAPAQVAELARLASDGLARRLVERRKARGEGMHRTEEIDASYRRLREELGVIERTGFAGYFLIVADFCQWARRNGIPLGPGRGSAAGSLAVYSLGITDVDPERWGLMFERFLNAERAGGMPDIDVDICKRGRARVIDYLRDRYGADAVGRIATFSAMGGKSALKDVGRVLGVGFGELNRALAGAPALVNGKTPTVDWLADNVESLREAVADPTAPAARRLAAVVRHALVIEAAGCVRQAGTHASGVVVSRGPLADWVPISGAGHELATQWAMEEVELAGLVKLDLLGLSTVTHLALAERYVNDANSEEKRGSHVEQDVLARTDGRALAQPGTAPRRALEGVAGGARPDTPPRRGDAHLADRELLLPDGDDARGREAAAGRAWREGEALRSGELRDGDSPSRRPKAAVSRGFSLDRVPLDDAATLRLVAAADTLGIFQLGKGGMRRLLGELAPDRYEDIVAACALYRPGPIQGGMVKDYVARRHGRTRVEYLHPALEAATGETYGVLAYQEQVMALARALAGYTLGQADILRKAMGKKKPEVMAKERAKFVAGCVATGSCDEARATELFELVAKWAGYGFNKSVDADTLIRDTSGNEKRIADFMPGDLVWSVGMGGDVEVSRVVAKHDHGVLDGFAVEFDDGSRVVCTRDHKFLTDRGQMPLWRIIADDVEVLSVGAPEKACPSPLRRNASERPSRWSVSAASEDVREVRVDQAPEHHESNARDRQSCRGAREALRCRAQNVGATRDSSSAGREIASLEREESRRISKVYGSGAAISKEFQGRSVVADRRSVAAGADQVRRREEAGGFCLEFDLDRSGRVLSFFSGQNDETRSARSEAVSHRASAGCDAERRSSTSRRHAITPVNGVLQDFVGRDARRMAIMDGFYAPISDTGRMVRRRVVRVLPVGPRRMYDLEVSAATHNYILPGGIVTSNSHSVCYGLISYRTAYVKAHYPAAFYAAWLSILCDEADATKKIAEAVYDARAHGVAVLPPNVNASAVDFLPVTLPPSARLDDRDGTGRPAVLYGLGALRGLGAAATSQIVARRPFRSLDDFLSRVEINKRDLVALAGSGALDPLLPEGVSRARVLANLTPLVSYAKRARSPQLSLL